MPNIFVQKSDVPVDPNDVNFADNTNTGVYLENTASSRNIGYFRIYQADSSANINSIAGPISSSAPDVRWVNVISDVLENSSVSVQLAAGNLAQPRNLDFEPGNIGTYYQIILTDHLSGRGAFFANNATGSDGYFVNGSNTYVENRNMGAAVDFQASTQNAFRINEYDARVVLSRQIAVPSRLLDQLGIVQPELQGLTVALDTIGTVGQSNFRIIDASVGIYDVFDLPDQFYQHLGFSSAEGFAKVNFHHELRHGHNIPILGGIFGGHGGVLSTVFSASSSTPFTTVTEAMVLNSTVEQENLAFGLSTGSISDQSKWVQHRVDSFNSKLKRAAEAEGLDWPLKTAGDVHKLRASGALDADISKLFIGLDGEELVVKEDWIVTGAADWGLVGVTAASALGSSLGRRLFGDNKVAGALSGAVLGEITKQAAAEILAAAGNSSQTVEYVANRTFEDIGVDIAGAGAGAVTSYLIGEVFSELGVNGFAGEALNSAASFGLSTIASNLTKQALGQTIDWDAGLTGPNFLNFAGSFLGSKLASFVKTFDSVGGQIGFSVGGAAGAALAAGAFAKSAGIVANFLAPGVGAFVGALLGGLIGSIFGGGGTPESGAHVVWDANTGTFTTGTSWADNWGSGSADNSARDRAIDVATTAGDVLNRVVDGLGDSASAYQNPGAIGAGAYGQRQDKWLYWGNGENSQNHALSGSYDEAITAINHGLRVAMDSVTMQGGDIYLKRALYRNLENNTSRADFDFSSVLGDLSIGADLSFYHENRALIDASIALAPESALAQGWVLTLIRAGELDLDQHYRSDFFGGLQGYLAGSNFLKDTGLNLADIQFEINQGDLVISDGVEQLPTGAASVTGWNTAFSAEARWAAVAGPDGETITAMETGQANTGKSGGGALATNTFEIDETQTYEYTVYVRRHDLTKSHRLYLGAAGGTVVDAVTGAQNTNPYFYYTISGPSGKPLQDDRWYKIVGYILPEGDRLTSHADKGGVYDTVTGEKIASVTNFAWDPNKTRSTAYMRYFSYYGATDQGYSTYWHQPSVRVVTENSAGTNLLDLAGWPADLHNTNVITDFAATMGYAAPVTTSVSRTGTIYSDVIFASGSGNINIYDNSSSTVANGPSMSGLSRLSDDIFVGNSGNNNIYGYAGWDWLEGGDGVDRLYGGEGDDFLSGGDGNDYVAHATLTGNVPGGLFGGNGNDTLVGGAGSDAVYGENGDDILLVDQDYNWDYLHGGAGSDTVSFENFDTAVTVDMGDNGGNNAYTAIQYRDGWVSIENLTGSKYSDTLQGNNSANVLTGLSGDDTINGHGGNDTIIGGAGADTINGGSGTDTVSYRKSNRGVQVSLKDGTARGGDAQGDQISAIENIEGSDQSDVLQGGTASGQLQGLGGSDIFLGSPGATQFLGGEGIDTVDYSSSTAGVNVRLDIGTGAAGYASGDSYISIEQVIGSAFNDVLYGTSESDRLQGGAGNDYLYGQLGDDSYAFTAGSGLDRITDSGGLNDYIIIDSDIALNDLQISKSGSTLVLQHLGSSDQIYVNSHFANTANRIDKLAWENGSQIFLFDSLKFYKGTAGANTIYGSNTHDFVQGHSGDDTLYGFDGADTLIGGAGNDTLYGGNHRDFYVFGRGSGLDTIIDTEGSDVLVMVDDISASDLLIEYQGSDLYIGLKVPGNANITAFNAPDRVIIKNQLIAASAIEGLQLGDQYVSLPKLVGGATGSNNAPQITTSVLNRYAPFYGGILGYVGSYDAEGDSLTFTVNSYSNGFGVTGNHYFVNGTNQLYSSTYWLSQDQAATTLNISAADGTNTTTGNIAVNWLPDPNGGPLWPIVLDLDGDGVELVQPKKSGIKWDVNEDGYIDKIGWAGPDDAFLAIDRDGSGLIEGVDEISFINDLEGATTDLEGLRGFDFDENGVSDGMLDENDVFYSDFRIWQDSNQDGLSDASELKTLAEAGIDYIDLEGKPTGQTVTNIKKNTILNIGTFVRTDGSTSVFGDVALGVKHGKPKGRKGRNEKNLSKSSFDKFFAKSGKVNKRTREDGSDDESGRLAPIILDLDYNGINLISIAESEVEFDADNDGNKEWTGWVSSGDGILVRDLDGDGLITRGEEMSFTQYLTGAETDLQGLAAFDSNEDGVITAADQDWGSFGVWIDSNSDGISQGDELVLLDELEIGQILLTASTVDLENGGNVIHQFGEFIKTDGSRVALADVSLGFLGLEESDKPVNPTAQALPTINDLMDWDFDEDLMFKDRFQQEGRDFGGLRFNRTTRRGTTGYLRDYGRSNDFHGKEPAIAEPEDIIFGDVALEKRHQQMIQAMSAVSDKGAMSGIYNRQHSGGREPLWMATPMPLI